MAELSCAGDPSMAELKKTERRCNAKQDNPALSNHCLNGHNSRAITIKSIMRSEAQSMMDVTVFMSVSTFIPSEAQSVIS